MSVDTSIISYVAKKPSTLADFQRAGITADYFVDDYEKVWTFILRSKRQHGRVPSPEVIATRYPEVEIHRVRDRDVPLLLSEIQQRKKYMDFLDYLDTASREVNTPDDTESALARLQQNLNSLSSRNGNSAIVDLFGKETRDRIVKDVKARRRGVTQGIPTSFKKFDRITGGLHKKRMAVVIGRPGLGKSWLDLLFCASAVMSGHKVCLFPLEMSLEDTAFRLYTVFSQKMLGEEKVFKNLDLTRGRVNPKRLARFLGMLEDKFGGQLLVADIGTLSDPYTIERIHGEVQMHGPDMFWVDYITLLKSHIGRDGVEDHTTIKALSNGIYRIAVAENCVGGATAQVSREAVKSGIFLPRLEHIAYGDAIGQDAHQVVSINRRGKTLYYALVKNRQGPEFGKTRLKFQVNDGIIEEDEEQDEEE